MLRRTQTVHRNDFEEIDGREDNSYNIDSHLKLLRGWVKFPTGGKARELSSCSADPVMIPEPTVQSG